MIPVVNVVLVHLEYFVVAHDARIAKIQNACNTAFCSLNGKRKERREYGHRVRHVDDFGVVHDLGDEIAGCQFRGDWHTNAQRQTIVVIAQQIFDKRLFFFVQIAFIKNEERQKITLECE